jgi:hypothetical protein
MFQNSLKLGVESGYVQDEVESQKSSIYDVLVYLRRKFVPSFGTADYSLQLSNIIPTSKDAAENTSHEFGIGVSGKVFQSQEPFFGDGLMSMQLLDSVATTLNIPNQRRIKTTTKQPQISVLKVLLKCLSSTFRLSFCIVFCGTIKINKQLVTGIAKHFNTTSTAPIHSVFTMMWV